MKIFDRISEFFNKYLFNAKWRCVVCNKEIFNDGYFCDNCKKELPVQNGAICEHCGRKLKVSQNYCTTCKGKLVNIDKSRSAYDYAQPINVLIKRLKYYNGRYLAKLFAQDLANVYFKNYFNADCVTFVPMTKKAYKKRGYNQSEILAKEFCALTNLPLVECLEKTKETNRQATLNKEERIKNLKDCFKATDRKLIKEKKVIIIDDVSTTGSTAEVLAKELKRVGAKEVFLLTVASVPPKDGY